MKGLMVRFVRDDEGQDLMVHALLATVIALVVFVGASLAGTSLNSWYTNISKTVDKWGALALSKPIGRSGMEPAPSGAAGSGGQGANECRAGCGTSPARRDQTLHPSLKEDRLSLRRGSKERRSTPVEHRSSQEPCITDLRYGRPSFPRSELPVHRSSASMTGGSAYHARAQGSRRHGCPMVHWSIWDWHLPSLLSDGSRPTLSSLCDLGLASTQDQLF